jgi:hypothetical protein
MSALGQSAIRDADQSGRALAAWIIGSHFVILKP